jgi:hypothetical protein
MGAGGCARGVAGKAGVEARDEFAVELEAVFPFAVPAGGEPFVIAGAGRFWPHVETTGVR